MSNIIEVRNLKKSFKVGNSNVEVLKGLSFGIRKGEFLSIMGPSGCGKSTLLYLLGGLDKANSGEVLITDKDISLISEKQKSEMRRKDIGFVFQFYNLVQNLSVEENIILPLLIDGKKKKDYKKKLDDVLEVVGLSERRKFTPRELSGGQQQRVAIARSLIFEPKIILADEPIGNLDSKSGKDVMELFRNINRKFGTTIVQVTHSEEAAKYGSNILRIRDGEIENKTKII